MGDISKKLHRKLASKADNLPTTEPKRRPGELLPGGFKDMQMLIKDGLDPVHAAYVYIQQMSSHFAELVSKLPEMKLFAKLAGDAEEEYMPSGTTPYILIESTKDDWMQFLKRTLLKVDGINDRDRLHQLLKFGIGKNYWNEFVFTAYHHHQAQAIFFAGIPDLKSTLPHA